jgi:hypothetical protein
VRIADPALRAPHLPANFEWIVSDPEFSLVVLVTFFQEQNQAAGTTSTGS